MTGELAARTKEIRKRKPWPIDQAFFFLFLLHLSGGISPICLPENTHFLLRRVIPEWRDRAAFQPCTHRYTRLMEQCNLLLSHAPLHPNDRTVELVIPARGAGSACSRIPCPPHKTPRRTIPLFIEGIWGEAPWLGIALHPNARRTSLFWRHSVMNGRGRRRRARRTNFLSARPYIYPK